jgi:hypothetical protein
VIDVAIDGAIETIDEPTPKCPWAASGGRLAGFLYALCSGMVVPGAARVPPGRPRAEPTHGFIASGRGDMSDSPAESSTRNAGRSTRGVLAVLPTASLVGFLALAVNATLSFEEPHFGMLLGSGLLLLVTPLGVALHLMTTRELTRAEKRPWFVGLTGRRGIAFLAAYLEGVRSPRARRPIGERASASKARANPEDS